MVELSLRTALDAVPKDSSISVAAEFLQSQGILVLGDVPPSSMSVHYGKHSIRLEVKDTDGRWYAELGNVDNGDIIPYDPSNLSVSVGFLPNLILTELDCVHWTAACHGSQLHGGGVYLDDGSYYDEEEDTVVDISDPNDDNYPYYGIDLVATGSWGEWEVKVHFAVDMTREEANIIKRYEGDAEDFHLSFEEWMSGLGDDQPAGRVHKVNVEVNHHQ